MPRPKKKPEPVESISAEDLEPIVVSPVNKKLKKVMLKKFHKFQKKDN